MKKNIKPLALILFSFCTVVILLSCKRQTPQKLSHPTNNEKGEISMSPSLSHSDEERLFLFTWKEAVALGDIEEASRLLVKEMTDEELVGQLFMFGYAGKEAGRDIKDWVKNKSVASVKIFGWNGSDLQQVCRSVTALQQAATESRLGIPLFIATDQEGGWVRHIKAQTSITPGNMAIAAAGFMQDSYLSSYYIAEELRHLGINMNFAPTVDLFLDKESTIIGSRAFCQSPEDAANLSVAFYHGHEAQRVITTAKHFPGHGNCKGDSHGRLPVIKSDINFLYQNDLVPYLFLIKEGIPSIMVGHISFPNITNSEDPATLSSRLIKQLLREELGYNGIVITDDLNMAGMRKAGVKNKNKSLEALKAGNDIVLISRKQSAERQYLTQWNSVISELTKNQQFKLEAQKSAVRIIRTKLTYLSDKNAVPLFPDDKTILEKVPSEEGKIFFFNQACRSVTRITSSFIPLKADSSIVLAGFYSDFFREGKKRFPKSTNFNTLSRLNNAGHNRTFNELRQAAKNRDAVIISVSDDRTLKLAKALRAAGIKVYALSTFMPGYAEQLTGMNDALAVYGVNKYSCQAAFAVFRGDFSPNGKLPYGKLP